MSDEKVVQLRQERPADNVSASLRALADEIESGKHGDYPVTTCVVLIGHTDSEVLIGNGELAQATFWSTRGYGPRCDAFTVRGLMATALRKWSSED